MQTYVYKDVGARHCSLICGAYLVLEDMLILSRVGMMAFL